MEKKEFEIHEFIPFSNISLSCSRSSHPNCMTFPFTNVIFHDIQLPNGERECARKSYKFSFHHCHNACRHNTTSIKEIDEIHSLACTFKFNPIKIRLNWIFFCLSHSHHHAKYPKTSTLYWKSIFFSFYNF